MARGNATKFGTYIHKGKPQDTSNIYIYFVIDLDFSKFKFVGVLNLIRYPDNQNNP